MADLDNNGIEDDIEDNELDDNGSDDSSSDDNGSDDNDSDDNGSDDNDSDDNGSDDSSSDDGVDDDDLDDDGHDDDELEDSGSDDDWASGLGDDSFHGGLGDDHIDGGEGIDTAHFEHEHENYTITHTESGIEVNHDTGTEGHDVLANVERLSFADTSLAFDIDGNAGQAYRLYEAAFNRESDNEGLGFWIDTLDGGSSLLDVATGFTNSAEFLSLYGENGSNDDFINTLYNNVLDRNGDSGGHNFWVGHLEDGSLSREQVLVEFSESAENQSNALGIIGDSGIDFTPFIG